MKSASLASDVPPGAVARNRIWSSFSVVGLSTTVAPFDSVHSVMPASDARRRLDDRAARRRRVHQGLARRAVHVRLDRFAAAALHGRRELRLIGQRRRRLLPARTRSPAGSGRETSRAASALTSRERDAREEPAMERELLPDRRQRFALAENCACTRRRGSRTRGRGFRSRRARSRASSPASRAPARWP